DPESSEERPRNLQLRLVNIVGANSGEDEGNRDKGRVHRLQGLGNVIVTLGKQVEAADTTAEAGPDREEASGTVGGDGRMHLLANGGGIDSNFAAHMDAGASEDLRVNTFAGAVLGEAGPGNEVVSAQGADLRYKLVTIKVGVDRHDIAGDAGCRIRPGED